MKFISVLNVHMPAWGPETSPYSNRFHPQGIIGISAEGDVWVLAADVGTWGGDGRHPMAWYRYPIEKAPGE
jgi:hypothetical protein